MKKFIVLLIITTLLLSTFSFAETEEVTVTIPPYDVAVNGVKIDIEHSQYPIINYKNITYIPMTSDYLAGLGLRLSFDGMSGLTIDLAESVTPLEQNFIGVYNVIGSSHTAKLVPFDVTVNGNQIDNSKEEYPILLYKNITYFPMTWRFAVTEFEWKTQWSNSDGFSITIDKEDFFEILKIEDLFEINDRPDESFKLVNDLDFNNINHYRDSEVYNEYKSSNSLPVDLVLKSKLDGNGYTISNLSLSTTTYEEIAFFKKIDNGAKIKNLKLDNFTANGKSDVALLTISNFGTIENVEVNGRISGTDIMGGIAVHNFYIIRDCKADVDITGNYIFDVAQSYTGGIVGRNRGVVERVTTNGTISGYNSLGGVVGINYYILRNAVSNVEVSSSNEDGDYTGGIVGINDGGRVENVISYGEIAGNSYTGGLVGSNEDGIVINSVAANNSISGNQNVSAVTGRNRLSDTTSDDYGTYNNYYFSNITISATKKNTGTDTMGVPVNPYSFVNLSQDTSFWNVYKGTLWNFQTIWQVINNQVQLQE